VYSTTTIEVRYTRTTGYVTQIVAFDSVLQARCGVEFSDFTEKMQREMKQAEALDRLMQSISKPLPLPLPPRRALRARQGHQMAPRLPCYRGNRPR
jgi:hypothetical protein